MPLLLVPKPLTIAFDKVREVKASLFLHYFA